MIRKIVLAVFGIAFTCGAVLNAQESYVPEDPIAAVDGSPVLLGELNLLLRQQFPTRSLDQLPVQVQQAAAFVLVRRHLAMESLLQMGGGAIRSQVDRRWDAYQAELQRTGRTVNEAAQRLSANASSMQSNQAWQTAWGQYLKSRLTEANLKKFFERNRADYGGREYSISQLVLSVDRADSQSRTVMTDEAQSIYRELASGDQSESEFAELFLDYGKDQPPKTWVSVAGDLPVSVLAVVRSQAQTGLRPPVSSPLGIHLVYVHEVREKDVTFEGLTDRSALRRDATNWLFESLVAKQAEAKVQWFIPELKPPPNVVLVPNPGQ